MAEPEIDAIQDWELLSGHETDTHTILKFRRPLVTCDHEHDLPITVRTTHMLISYIPSFLNFKFSYCLSV